MYSAYQKIKTYTTAKVQFFTDSSQVTELLNLFNADNVFIKVIASRKHQKACCWKRTSSRTTAKQNVFVQGASLTERNKIGSHTPEIATFGVFSYFRCKIWRHILAQQIHFLQRWRNFVPTSLCFRDLTRDRQTRRQKQMALTFNSVSLKTQSGK